MQNNTKGTHNWQTPARQARVHFLSIPVFLSFPVVPPRNVRPASMVKEALAVNFLNKSVATFRKGREAKVCVFLVVVTWVIICDYLIDTLIS